MISKSKTYNDIVARPPEAVPLILIVLCLPEDEGGWLQATEIQTTLKNCCYWFKPSGGVTPNLGSIRIRIPRRNLLTAASLTDLLADARVSRKGSQA